MFLSLGGDANTLSQLLVLEVIPFFIVIVFFTVSLINVQADSHQSITKKRLSKHSSVLAPVGKHFCTGPLYRMES